MADTVVVTFEVPHYQCLAGEHLSVVGSIRALGHWCPERGVSLTWHEGHMWSGEVAIQKGLDWFYKLVLVNDANQVVRWEGGDDTYQSSVFAPVRIKKWWAGASQAEDRRNDGNNVRCVMHVGSRGVMVDHLPLAVWGRGKKCRNCFWRVMAVERLLSWLGTRGLFPLGLTPSSKV